jgi:hypothetical protein
MSGSSSTACNHGVSGRDISVVDVGPVLLSDLLMFSQWLVLLFFPN